MHNVKISEIKRVFRFQGTEYADPSPGQAPQKCLEILSVAVPKLNNAACETPVVENGKEVINIKEQYGAKG